MGVDDDSGLCLGTYMLVGLYTSKLFMICIFNSQYFMCYLLDICFTTYFALRIDTNVVGTCLLQRYC